jgi:hypothetical protein
MRCAAIGARTWQSRSSTYSKDRRELRREQSHAAMKLPRFGRGNHELDAFGDQIIGRVAGTAVEVFTDPAERTAGKMLGLARRLGTRGPFGFQVQPGVGTFENYLDWGNMSGASADGRLSGDPLASDLSPAPSFGDLPIDPNEAPLLKVMEGFKGRGVEAMWDGADGLQHPRGLSRRRAGTSSGRLR